MTEIPSYIMSVTAAAVLCAVVGVLAGDGTAGKLLKLMTGIVMAVVVIRPIAGIGTVNLNRYLEQLNLDALEAVAEGSEYTREETASRIKQELESYILGKAASLSAEITVEVTLHDQTMLPVSAVITGRVSPYAKGVMEDVFAEDLGIPTEALTWN